MKNFNHFFEKTLACSVAKNGWKYPLTLGHLHNLIKMTNERLDIHIKEDIENNPLKYDQSIKAFCNSEEYTALTLGLEYKCIPIRRKAVVNKNFKTQIVYENCTLAQSTVFRVKNDEGKNIIYEKILFDF